MEQRSGGWPALLQVMLQHGLTSHFDAASITSGDSSAATSFFETRLLVRLDTNVRHALLRLSLLTNFTPVLAVALTISIGWSTRTLMAGLFLLPLAGLFTMPLLSGLAAQVDDTGRLPALCAGAGFLSQAFGSALGTWLIESGGPEALSTAVLIVGSATLVAALSCYSRLRSGNA